MGKRRADASSRRFFDEFPKIRVSRFRADGTIDPAKNVAVIPCADGSRKLLGVTHVHFPNGGGWSLFRCLKCGRRAATLYLVSDQPLCVKCCGAMGIEYRSRMGFGRAARRQASDRRLDELIAKLETTKPLRLNGAPPSWEGKAQLVTQSQRLTDAMRRRLIALRLSQLTKDYAMKGDALKTCVPFAATKQLIDLKPIYRARTHEALQLALDQALITILKALESDDPQARMAAVRLMMRTKQARDRGLAA
jgi:hypothetical protein